MVLEEMVSGFACWGVRCAAVFMCSVRCSVVVEYEYSCSVFEMLERSEVDYAQNERTMDLKIEGRSFRLLFYFKNTELRKRICYGCTSLVRALL